MYAIAIDIGGTTIKSAIVSANAEIFGKATTSTSSDPQQLVLAVAEEVKRLRELAETQGLQLVDTVGVVAPGIINDKTGTAVLSANLGWRNVPMQQLLENTIGRPVQFGHDVRAGALAENLWGSGQGADNLLYVAVGTGIGGALVFCKQPYVGGGWAAEIGQILVNNPDGKGKKCLEKVASAEAIRCRYQERSGDSVDGAAQVYALKEQGCADAKFVIETAHQLLAESLATTVCVLGEIRIVVGGGLAAGPREEFVEPLEKLIADNLIVHPAPQVVKASLGSWSQCLGSGALALQATGVEIKTSNICNETTR